MTKTFPLCAFLLCLVVFAGCNTVRYRPVEEKNYSDAEIVLSEIERIDRMMAEAPEKALWLSWVLAQKSGNEAAEDCFERCLSTVEASVAGQPLLDQARLRATLATFGREPVTPAGGEDWFTTEVAPHLATPEKARVSRIADLIKGTVTVWVDRGLKVAHGRAASEVVIGSGFFIDDRGYLVTNYHVISSEVDPEYEGFSALYVKLSGDSETRVPAKVVGWDKTLDLALLKTEITPAYVFALNADTPIDAGTRVFAIGSPMGLTETVTSGIVSALNRDVGMCATVMQLDAAVNAGNSGGPLVNEDGLLEGIVFAGLPDYEGLNFAIPMEYLAGELPALYAGGEVTHSWCGMYGKTYKELPSDEAGTGVQILYVLPGSPAHDAGLLAGDVLTAVNGIPVADEYALQNLLLAERGNVVLPVTVYNPERGETRTTPLFFEVRPDDPVLLVLEREPIYRALYPVMGLKLTPVSANKKRYVVSSVMKGSAAQDYGFSENDPFEIIRYRVLKDEGYLTVEASTKKRSSGYLDVNVGLAAPLDSRNYF